MQERGWHRGSDGADERTAAKHGRSKFKKNWLGGGGGWRAPAGCCERRGLRATPGRSAGGRGHRSGWAHAADARRPAAAVACLRGHGLLGSVHHGVHSDAELRGMGMRERMWAHRWGGWSRQGVGWQAGCRVAFWGQRKPPARLAERLQGSRVCPQWPFSDNGCGSSPSRTTAGRGRRRRTR